MCSRFKKILWPPIPNLDKVLQGFLAEINGPTWVRDFHISVLVYYLNQGVGNSTCINYRTEGFQPLRPMIY